MPNTRLILNSLTDYDINVFYDLVISELAAFDKLETEPETIEYFDGLADRISTVSTIISESNPNGRYINTYIHLDDLSFIRKILLSHKERLEEILMGAFFTDDHGPNYVAYRREIDQATDDFHHIKRLLDDLDKLENPLSSV